MGDRFQADIMESLEAIQTAAGRKVKAIDTFLLIYGETGCSRRKEMLEQAEALLQ